MKPILILALARFKNDDAYGIEVRICQTRFRLGMFRRKPTPNHCRTFRTRGAWQIRNRWLGVAFRSSTFAIILLALCSCAPNYDRNGNSTSPLDKTLITAEHVVNGQQLAK